MAEKWEREIEEILKGSGDTSSQDSEIAPVESEMPSLRKASDRLSMRSARVFSGRQLSLVILGLLVTALLLGARFIGLAGFILLLIAVALVGVAYLVIRARRPSPSGYKTPASSNAGPRKNPPQETHFS